MIYSTRRQFIKTASVISVTGGLPWARFVLGADETPEAGSQDQKKPLPTITLGSTGRVVPRLGLGAAPIGQLKTDEEAVAVLRHAFELGIRYIDTAPSYSRGASERRVGLALQGQKRSEFFIATKTLQRNGDDARREIEQSLKHLGVEYVDCLQVHAVHDDVDSLFGDDAVLKALEKARDEGIIRHIGVTGHANPEHLIDAISRYDFATALAPVNPLDTKRLSFTRKFLPEAKKKRVAVVAMKIYAGGSLLESGRFTAAECIGYALSQDPVAVVVPGLRIKSHVDEAFAAAVEFAPLSDEQQKTLEERAGEHEGKRSEWYKQRSGT